VAVAITVPLIDHTRGQLELSKPNLKGRNRGTTKIAMALRGLSEDYYPSPSPLIEPSPSPGAVVEIELPQAEAEEDDNSGWHSAIATGVMGGIVSRATALPPAAALRARV
jgi:hypothetical protein